MLEINKQSKIQMHWNVSPYDYTKEKHENLREKVSKKYGIPKSHVKITPNFITQSSTGDAIPAVGDIITNIQDPKFQLELFKEYIKEKKIEDYDFEVITQIDNEINNYIDYEVYDKFRRYSIKWVKWDNFLSYGQGNSFDFTKLKDLVLLNGEPANQSGKTTFAVDLIHFLLFGKTTKVATLDKAFNKHLPQAKEVVVEGCINIEGEDYIIKRTLSRPDFKKRTEKSKVTQKVEYYKLVGETKEELAEYVESQEGESNVQTNKIIKEAIGKESDFDLIISITGSNLDALIEKKDTERGKLLARWIGLVPLEEKDKLARDTFNSTVKPYLLSNQYNTETLLNEVKAFKTTITELKKQTKNLEKENLQVEEDIKLLEETKANLLQAKQQVDASLLNVDSTTLKTTLARLAEEGKTKKSELENITNEINEIGEVDFSVNDYDAKVQERTDIASKRTQLGTEYKYISQQIESLTKSEYCPTCGKKLDNVDNTEKINSLRAEAKSKIEQGRILKTQEEQLEQAITALKNNRELFMRKSNLTVKLAALETKVAVLRGEYKESQNLLNEYLKNNEIIDKNNQLDIQIRNTDVALQNKRNTKDTNIRFITNNNNKVETYKEEINTRTTIVDKLKDEAVLLQNWKIYLEMVGKNGISKMVLRKTLPVINAHLSKMLTDVCDFDIDIVISDKGEVAFNIIKDGVRSDLSTGSGFEKTVAALALRIVLANISTIPRVNFIVMDEVLGRVAKENYDNMHNLYNKIIENYDFIIQISHLDEIKDWHSTILTIRKKDNVSTINVSANNIV